MKRTLFLIAGSLAMNTLFAQLPVSQTPQNKKVVLEQFTGMWCSACSGGDQAADNVAAANPGKVFIVNVHESTGYEDPNSILNPNITLQPPAPDFKTSLGPVLYSLPNMGIGGFPTASINRTILSGTTITTYQNNYTAYSNSILAQPAYCNVALQGTINVQTRVLTVEAEVYYTANSSASTNSLTIFLTESNIPGPQKDGWIGGTTYPAGWNPDGTYRHNNVLRASVTPTLGVTIPNTTSGTTYSTTATYTIPLTYGQGVNATKCLLGRLQLIGFVAESDVKIINAASGPLTLTNFANVTDVETTEFGNDAEVCEGKLNSTFKFINYGSSTVTTAVFAQKVNNNAVVNYTYTGPAVKPYTQSETIFLPAYIFPPQSSNSTTLDVVNVNSTTDQNASNNVSIKSSIPQTTNIAQSVNMQMDFTQDMYGYESTWKVYDEASGSIVASGGPYSNLGSGTQLHSSTFTLTINKCYKLVTTDFKKDGINNFAGSGNYVLKSNGTNLITSNGKYGKGETRWFTTNTSLNTSFVPDMVQDVTIYPNPAVTNANLQFNLTTDGKVEVRILNALGQLVFEQSSEMASGMQNLPLNTQNFAAGLYHVTLSVNGITSNHKLMIER